MMSNQYCGQLAGQAGNVSLESKMFALKWVSRHQAMFKITKWAVAPLVAPTQRKLFLFVLAK